MAMQTRLAIVHSSPGLKLYERDGGLYVCIGASACALNRSTASARSKDIAVLGAPMMAVWPSMTRHIRIASASPR